MAWKEKGTHGDRADATEPVRGAERPQPEEPSCVSQGQPEREPSPRPASAHSGASLERTVHGLLSEFLGGDANGAFERLIARFAPHLAAVAESAAIACGLLADPADLVREWFSGVFIDTRPASALPTHPVCAAEEWVRDRARELVGELAAQPMPWEKGYHDGKLLAFAGDPGQEFGAQRPSRAAADAELLYVMNVAFHRLDELDRVILRSADVDRTLPADTGERLGMTEDQVIEALSAARVRLEALCRRPTSEDAGDA
jgi:hypothetical protein